MKQNHSTYSCRAMTDEELARYNASVVIANGISYRVPFDVAEKVRQLESMAKTTDYQI